MKRTLLDLTQSILSSLNSDEVNSISDTVESAQIAEIIKTTYFNMMSRYDLAKHNQLFQLTASNSGDQPVLMYKPDGVGLVEWIKYYDVNSEPAVSPSAFIHDLNLDITPSTFGGTSAPAYKEVRMLPVNEFIQMVNEFNTDLDDVESFELSIPNSSTGASNTFTFAFRNDKTPQYCTILQNYYIIFDSYDETVDSTLQSSKTQCYGLITPQFSMTDAFIPDLDDQQFPLLLNEAKSLAFYELKQVSHAKAEKEISRQASSLQKFNSVSNKPSYFAQLPDFGRGRTR